MRKKMILAFTFILFMLFFLQGCSSIKDESELLEDIQSSNSFSLPSDAEVKNLSIIKRLTDEKSKTDKVYVQVDVENTAFFQSRAYIMNYTHYNEGWMLDNAEEYWEDEYWVVHPKTVPNEETILDELIAWSNSSIQANYDWTTIEYPIPGPLFFEKGKYEVVFTDGNLEDAAYTCVVSVARPFEYVTAFEDILVTLVIDPYYYSWELVSAESIALSADWYVARDWSSDETYFYFSELQLTDNSLILSSPVAYGYSIYDTELMLEIPTFECITPATAIMAYSGFRGDIYGEITLWPDRMWVMDSDGELAEFTGTIEYCSAGLKTTEKYAKFAQDFFESLYLNHDIESFLSMVHPSMQSEFSGMGTPDWENAPTYDDFDYGGLEIYYVKNSYEADFCSDLIASLREENYNVDELGVLKVVLVLDGEQQRLDIPIMEDAGKLYAYLSW